MSTDMIFLVAMIIRKGIIEQIKATVLIAFKVHLVKIYRNYIPAVTNIVIITGNLMNFKLFKQLMHGNEQGFIYNLISQAPIDAAIQKIIVWSCFIKYALNDTGMWNQYILLHQFTCCSYSLTIHQWKLLCVRYSWCKTPNITTYLLENRRYLKRLRNLRPTSSEQTDE